jgi:glycosyltransferase involved in cell wall biosynthesis
MRILFLNQYFPPDVSATAYLLGELSEDLARHHEIWVVAGRPSYDPQVGTFRPQGVHLERSWSTRFNRDGMGGRLANYGSFVFTSLVRAMRAPRPDVVVAMTDPPVIGLIGLLVSRRFGCPFVYVCQDIFPDVGVALKRADNPIAVWLWRRLNGQLRRGASRIVAIGRDMRDKLVAERVPSQKVVFIPNWASDEQVDERVRAETRRSMNWEGKFVVMHGGNVGLAQNLDVVIDAADLLQARPIIQFVILGDGAARQRLQREAELRALPNVSFIPYRPKKEAQALLAAADLHTVTLAAGLWGCVVPSKVYGVMALGVPFVAALEKESEVDRIIEETGAGVRVDPTDAHGLAQAVREFADGTRDAKLAGARGRAEFEAKYQRQNVTERYRQLLEAVSKTQPTPRGARGDRQPPL